MLGILYTYTLGFVLVHKSGDCALIRVRPAWARHTIGHDMKNFVQWFVMLVALTGFFIAMLATGLGLIHWLAGGAYCLILLTIGACSSLVIND